MGKAFIDRTGQQYGKLTVISFIGKPLGKSKALWECSCTCGNTTYVTSSNLTTGHTTSCGCVRREFAKNKRLYPEEYSDEYRIWRGIKQRTKNPKGKNSKWYSGVTMCPEWSTSFIAFLSDMGKRPSSLHSIERLNVKEGYSAKNCVWATPKEQANNRSTNVVLQHNQESLTVAQWAEKTQLKQATISARLRRGWDVFTSLTAPLNQRMNNVSK